MIDLYIKADSQQGLYDLLISKGFERDQESDLIYRSGVLLDEIGTIYRETGKMLTDEEGYEFPETEAEPGYHANLRIVDDKIANEFDDIAVDVKTPARVWA